MTYSQLNKFSGFLLLIGLIVVSCTSQEEASQEEWDGKISSINKGCDYYINEEIYPVDCQMAYDFCYGVEYPNIYFTNWGRQFDDRPLLKCEFEVYHSFHSPCLYGWCSDYSGLLKFKEVSDNSSQG